jgi:DNA-binding NarL/FixJ family response regulator
MTAAATRPLRIVIADDHEIFAEGLAELLKSYPELDVVGRASDGLEAVSLASALNPDVVLMDVEMPCLDGIGATQHIVADGGDTRVVMLSSSTEPETVAAARLAGAVDYLFKGCSLDDMLAAIEEVRPFPDLTVHAA